MRTSDSTSGGRYNELPFFPELKPHKPMFRTNPIPNVARKSRYNRGSGFPFRFEKVSVVRVAKNPKTMDYGKHQTSIIRQKPIRFRIGFGLDQPFAPTPGLAY
jgi:hypothetical protein